MSFLSFSRRRLFLLSLDETLPNDDRIHVLFLSVRSRLETSSPGDKPDPTKAEAIPDREGRIVVFSRGSACFAFPGRNRPTLEDEVEYGPTVAECRALKVVGLAELFADLEAADGGRDEETGVLWGWGGGR